MVSPSPLAILLGAAVAAFIAFGLGYEAECLVAGLRSCLVLVGPPRHKRSHGGDEAHDLGWRLTVYCRWGKRDGMKSIRECHGRLDADLATLVWTRGRAFPIARLEGRMKCPRCGSRRVLIAAVA